MVKRIQGRPTAPRPNDIAQTVAPPVELPRLLTTAEAARVLGMKAQTLSIWRCTKRYPLRYVKMGGAVRYLMADLVRFLEAAAVTPAGDGNVRLLRRASPRRQVKSGTSN